MSEDESRVSVLFREIEYSVVSPIKGKITESAKELVLNKLKSGYGGCFFYASWGNLFFYEDKARKKLINSRNVPELNDIYAILKEEEEKDEKKQEPTVCGKLKLDLSSVELQENFKIYDENSKVLANDDSVRSLAEELNSIRDWENPNPPFVFLDCSSGRGKTQMAFKIKTYFLKFHPDIKVLYFLCIYSNERSQPIYQVYRYITELFLKCADADLKNWNGRFDSMGSFSLRFSKLYLFGLFRRIFVDLCCEFPLLDAPMEQIEPIIGESLVDDLKSKGLNPPVVILDEYLPWDLKSLASEEKKNRLKAYMILLRSVFRSLGCAVIIMGTNSRAANLRNTQRVSRTSEKFSIWCKIRSRLPSPFFSHRENTNTIVQNLVLHSRPLFGHLLLESVGNLDLSSPQEIEICLVNVGRLIWHAKGSQNPLGFLRGQVGLFMSMYNDQFSSKLVHHHFADLSIESVDLSENFCFFHNGVEQKWRPSAVFPPMGDDILLYLCMLGLPGVAPFMIGNQAISFTHSWEVLKALTDVEELELDPRNVNQLSNDGMFLENLLASCAIAASHSGGISGVHISQFLNSFIYHLDKRNGPGITSYVSLNLDLLRNVKLFSEFVVPILSPPGKTWPDFMDQDIFKIGSLWRCENQKMIDFDTDSFISGESKHYCANISSDAMLKILQRIPETSRIHLVLVGSLQKTYFSRKMKQVKTEENPQMQQFSFKTTFNQKFQHWGFYYLENDRLKRLPIHAFDYEIAADESIQHLALFFQYNKL